VIDTYVRNIEDLNTKILTKAEEKNATDEQLIQTNLKFVIKEAHRFKNMGLQLNDLVQEGNIGLMEALNKFDRSKNIKFITFAVHYIRMKMRNALTSCNNHVTQSSAQIQKIKDIQKFTKKYKEQHNCLPHVKEISENLKISERIVENAINNQVKGFISIDLEINENGDSLEKILDPDSEQSNGTRPDVSLCDKDFKEYISKTIDRLTDKEAQVIRSRFFDNKTLKAIGEELGGMTPAGIKAIQDRALKGLKRKLKI